MNFLDEAAQDDDDDIEEFDEGDDDGLEEMAEAASPDDDGVDAEESGALSLAQVIERGPGSECVRAAGAVARVMIALKKRKLETPEGEPIDTSDFAPRERGKVCGSSGGAREQQGDDVDDDEHVASDDEGDVDYDPEHVEQEEEEEEELENLDYLFDSDSDSVDDDEAPVPDIAREEEDSSSGDDDEADVESAPANHDWLRVARKRASRKVRGRAYHQGRAESRLVPKDVACSSSDYRRLDAFAGDLGNMRVGVVFENLGVGTHPVLLEEGIPLGDALARLRVGSVYENPRAVDAGHVKGATMVDRWVKDFQGVITSSDVIVVTRDKQDLGGHVSQQSRGGFTADLVVDCVTEEPRCASPESSTLRAADGLPNAFKDSLTLCVVPSSRWTLRILQGSEKAIEFVAPALRLGLLEPATERLSRAAANFFIECNRPPKVQEPMAGESAPRYYPRLIHGPIRARKELSRGALTVRRVRETLALATMCEEILGSCLEEEEELSARASRNLILHVEHSDGDDPDTAGLPTFAYICQLDGRDDILSFVLQKYSEGRVSSDVNEGRHTYFSALPGLRKLGFSYEPSLGVRGIISPTTADQLRELRQPPMDHRQRQHLQISVTAMSSFAERRCERALFFDLAGMTSEERPAVMHSRMIGQKWEDQILELIATSRSSQEGALVLQDMGKGRDENQTILASLLDFMSALARGTRAQHAGDLQIPEDAAEKAFILHKCTMQLSHEEMCRVYHLPTSEADGCKFGTFEPDFLYLKKCSREMWEITVIDAKASRKAMLRHAVQLELYRVLIAEWLAVNNLSAFFRVSTQAGVWLMNEPWWTPIPDTDMKRSALIVKQLRSGEESANSLRSLIKTMSTSPRDVQWRLERRCEACVYQGHCTSEAVGSVRALPDQSAEAQTVMQSILSELGQGSEQDIEDVCGAVKKLPRHVSLYFSEGEPSEETTINILHGDPSSQQQDEGQRSAPERSGHRFIFDHVEGVREARAVVVRGRNLLARKESVREYVMAQQHGFRGSLVVGLEQWHTEDGPHPTVAFVIDSRGTELTSDAHWLKHRILRFDEDESAGTAMVEFRYAGETFRAQCVVRRHRQSARSLREVSIERAACQRGDVEMLRLGTDGVYRLTVAREEILRCRDGVSTSSAPLNLCEGREQPMNPTPPSAYDYVRMIDNIPAGMATQLFRSRQKLSACATGRVLPYDVKHKAFPLFAEDVGVYLSINSDPHLGEARSEYIFSWTALVRFHTANIERVVSHNPKSKVPPHETLIEYIHALFAQISDHNESIKSENGEERDDVRQFVKLQCYVFDPSEMEVLRSCVMKSALQMSRGNPTNVARLALDLVFCLDQSEDELLVEGEAGSLESDASDSTSPPKRKPPAPEVLCVLNCLRESLAFPAMVGLQLADAERAFGLSTGQDSFDLASLRDIFAYSGPESNKFSQAAERRLRSADRIVRAMREFVRFSVRSAPPNFVRSFHMAKAAPIDDVCLRHLEYVRNHEMSLERDEIRRPRLKRLEESIASGEVARLIFLEIEAGSLKEPFVRAEHDIAEDICRGIIETGNRAGERCSTRARDGGFCGRHKNSSRKLTRAVASVTCVNADSLWNFMGSDEFGLFVEETEEGIHLAVQFRDAAYAFSPCPTSIHDGAPVAFARVVSPRDARGDTVLELAWHHCGLDLARSLEPMRGRRFLLYKRHMSMVRFSQEKCMQAVRKDKTTQNPEMLRVCNASGPSASQAVGFFSSPDEKSWRAIQSTLRRTLSGEPGTHLSEAEQIDVLRREEEGIRAARVVTPLTDSQFKAYASVMRHQLTVIHGPPGTGKTECLAGILYRFAARLRASGSENAPGKYVCLSAFTKAAIVHVLAKSKPHSAMPMVCLFSSYNDARLYERSLPAHVHIFVKKNAVFSFHGIGGASQPREQEQQPFGSNMKLAEWLAQVRLRHETGAVCICGTAWQVQSAFSDKAVAPILKDGLALTIFDEASQMPLLDARRCRGKVLCRGQTGPRERRRFHPNSSKYSKKSLWSLELTRCNFCIHPSLYS